MREYIAYLRKLFKLLINYNIAIALVKIFLRYLNINLLKRRVDLFEIAIADDKLKAISEIKYLSILEDLEYYLKLIDYLRSFIYYYI